MQTALVALLCDVVLEVLRALVKRRLGRKQLPEPLISEEVKRDEKEA